MKHTASVYPVIIYAGCPVSGQIDIRCISNVVNLQYGITVGKITK